MRVLTVIDSLAVGGAEQSLAMLTPHLTARGVEVHVAYLAERPGVAALLEEGGAILHSLDGPGGRLRALGRTFRLIRSLRPTLVHTTLFKADIVGRTAAWLLRIPVVSSLVTESYGPEHVRNPEYHAWKVRTAQLVDATTARFVSRFHAVSASSADLMAHRLRVSRNKMEVIPRGRDPEQLGTRTAERRNGMRADLGIAADTPLVLAAARHYHLKGLDVAIRAFGSVVAARPDARLLIAGREGPATAELKRLITAAGINGAVMLAGYRSDVPDLMCAADVLVLPSRAEGSPGVLIEAMALELPAVASDIASIREIARGAEETAVLVSVDSPAEMAAGILRVLEDRSLAAALAAAGRRRYLSNYTMGAIADTTLALYETALQR